MQTNIFDCQCQFVVGMGRVWWKNISFSHLDQIALYVPGRITTDATCMFDPRMSQHRAEAGDDGFVDLA